MITPPARPLIKPGERAFWDTFRLSARRTVKDLSRAAHGRLWSRRHLPGWVSAYVRERSLGTVRGSGPCARQHSLEGRETGATDPGLPHGGTGMPHAPHVYFYFILLLAFSNKLFGAFSPIVGPLAWPVVGCTAGSLWELTSGQSSGRRRAAGRPIGSLPKAWLGKGSRDRGRMQRGINTGGSARPTVK